MQTIWDGDIITCAFLKTYSKKMNSHFRWYDPLLSSNDYGKNDLSKPKCLLVCFKLIIYHQSFMRIRIALLQHADSISLFDLKVPYSLGWP